MSPQLVQTAATEAITTFTHEVTTAALQSKPGQQLVQSSAQAVVAAGTATLGLATTTGAFVTGAAIAAAPVVATGAIITGTVLVAYSIWSWFNEG